MNKKLLIWTLTIIISSSLYLHSADVLFCKQIASYSMDIVLDTQQQWIFGEELVTWTNDTAYATDDLWFHIYWNAFQNNKSTFLIESSGNRTADFERDDWGYCHIEKIDLSNEL